MTFKKTRNPGRSDRKTLWKSISNAIYGTRGDSWDTAASPRTKEVWVEDLGHWDDCESR